MICSANAITLLLNSQVTVAKAANAFIQDVNGSPAKLGG